MLHQAVHTDDAPAAIGPYSQAIALPVGDRKLIFVAGQIPLDPATGELVDGSLAEQVNQIMANIEAILSEAGSDLGRVVKTTIFLADLADFAGVNEAYGQYFHDAPPARATVGVSALPKGADVEIEVLAYL